MPVKTIPSPILPADDSVPACPCGQESAMVLLGGLGGGYRALIHAVDAGLVAPYHWLALRTRQGDIRARRKWREGGREVGQYLHVLLTGHTPTDHKNGNPLDNRGCNLREATDGQNQCNSRKRCGSSRFKGVTVGPDGNWRAQIQVAGHKMHLGLCNSEEDAARIYDRAAIELHGEFARTNEMLGLL